MNTGSLTLQSALYRWGPIAAVFILGMAAAVQGVAVAPPRLELVASPGSTVTREVAVFARGAGEQRIVPGVHGWTLDPAGRLVLQDGTNAAFDASNWVSTTYNPFTLRADEPVNVKFEVALPDTPALEGSYWTALSFTTEPKPGKYKGVSVLVNTRALAVVYVTIQGTEQPSAELQGVTVVSDEKGGRRYLVADVANTGNVYLRLNGELRFVSTAGEVARRTPLPERVLLREGLVRYRLALPEDLPEDTILAQVEIQPQGPAGGYGGPPLYGEVNLK